MNSFTPVESRSFVGWILPAVQLAATLLVLSLRIENVLKLAAFAAIWALTFRRVSPREIVCFLVVSTLFSLMDIMAVRQGVFAFSHPDVAGLPVWEYFMWGFLILHILRTLDGPAPAPRWRLALPLAALFALPFGSLSNPWMLLAASACVLALSLVLFHETRDIYYVAYTVLLGAAFEYVGVWSGQWQYPRHPIGGVELWAVTMWAGIGLFARRLVLPLLSPAR